MSKKITKKQIGEIAKEALSECPEFKQTILSWFEEAMYITNNKPKQEVIEMALAMNE